MKVSKLIDELKKHNEDENVSLYFEDARGNYILSKIESIGILSDLSFLVIKGH